MVDQKKLRKKKVKKFTRIKTVHLIRDKKTGKLIHPSKIKKLGQVQTEAWAVYQDIDFVKCSIFHKLIRIVHDIDRPYMDLLNDC